MSDVKKRTIALVSEIDGDELTLRIMCIALGVKPIAGQTASEAVAQCERSWPVAVAGPFPFRRMAESAMEYIVECINKGQHPS